ncbi:hypothetical protein GEMRC1_003323 [Eukaryota sp. GEM-RC1]
MPSPFNTPPESSKQSPLNLRLCYSAPSDVFEGLSLTSPPHSNPDPLASPPEHQRWKYHDKQEAAKQKRLEHCNKRKESWRKTQSRINEIKLLHETKRQEMKTASGARLESAASRRSENMDKIRSRSLDMSSKVNEAVFIHNLSLSSRLTSLQNHSTKKLNDADSRRTKILEEQQISIKNETNMRIKRAEYNRKAQEMEKIERFMKREEERQEKRSRAEQNKLHSPNKEPTSRTRVLAEEDDGDEKSCLELLESLLNEGQQRKERVWCDRGGQSYSQNFKIVNLLSDFQLSVSGFLNSQTGTPQRKGQQKSKYFSNFQRIIGDISKISAEDDGVFHFLFESDFFEYFISLLSSELTFMIDANSTLLKHFLNFTKVPLVQLYCVCSNQHLKLLNFSLFLMNNFFSGNNAMLKSRTESLLTLFFQIFKNFSSSDTYPFLLDTIFFLLETEFPFLLFGTLPFTFSSSPDSITIIESSLSVFFSSLISCSASSSTSLSSSFLSSLLTASLDCLSSIVLSSCDFSTRHFSSDSVSSVLPSSPFTLALKSAKSSSISLANVCVVSLCLVILKKIIELPGIVLDLLNNSDLKLEILHCSCALLTICSVNIDNPSYYSIFLILMDILIAISSSSDGIQFFSQASIANMTLLSRLVSLPFLFFSDSILKVRVCTLICRCLLIQRHQPIIFDEIGPSLLIDFLASKQSSTYLNEDEKRSAIAVLNGL